MEVEQKTQDCAQDQTQIFAKDPRGRPRTRTYEELMSYHRQYYQKNKKPSRKSQCEFINYRGEHCPHITNRGYCFRHINRKPNQN